jgi:hypothetical protein
VNFPTSSFTTPAATPRTGWGESALPRPDQGTKTQSLPFAALPHDLRKDPRLKGNRTAIVLAAALLEYAPGTKPSCYPTNARLADDLGCCEQTVRHALADLQSAGWIRIARGSNQPNGRRIWLTWRCDTQSITVPSTSGPPHLSDTPQSVGPPLKSAGGPLKPVRPEEESVTVEGTEEESRQFARAIERPRGEPEPAPTAPPAQLPAPEPTAEALSLTGPGRPRTARPAILRAPAGPTPKATPSPVSGDRAASIAAGPCPSPASPPCAPRLARTQSGSPSEQGPPALVAAPDAPRGLANPPPIEPPQAAPAPAPSPATAGLALALTAEQQARLEALPSATRDLVLTWLLTGDPILVAEARTKLAPPRPRPEAPRTLPEVLGRIREDPSFPSLAADWLASALQDRKSYSGFKARCEEAWRGELEPRRLVAAYEQATGPKAKNPGALFMFALRCDARDG